MVRQVETHKIQWELIHNPLLMGVRIVNKFSPPPLTGDDYFGITLLITMELSVIPANSKPSLAAAFIAMFIR